MLFDNDSWANYKQHAPTAQLRRNDFSINFNTKTNPSNITFSLSKIAGSLLESRAVRRLSKVTFLGMLSPRFADLITSPISTTEPIGDGTRFDHSVNVAALALEGARFWGLSGFGQRYAAAWGLIHDIDVMPLSHTGEAAFLHTTGLTHEELRTNIILGASNIPCQLSIKSALKEMGISPPIIALLFNKSFDSLNRELSGQKRSEIRIIWELVHSVITPDTLDGIARCGRAWGVQIVRPSDVLAAIHPELFTLVTVSRYSSAVIDFWIAKSRVYEEFINNPKVVEWESRCSAALSLYFPFKNPVDAFDIDESAMIDALRLLGLPPSQGVRRYKNPLRYFVREEAGKAGKLRDGLSIELLNDIFVKSGGDRHGISAQYE